MNKNINININTQIKGTIYGFSEFLKANDFRSNLKVVPLLSDSVELYNQNEKIKPNKKINSDHK